MTFGDSLISPPQPEIYDFKKCPPPFIGWKITNLLAFCVFSAKNMFSGSNSIRFGEAEWEWERYCNSYKFH